MRVPRALEPGTLLPLPVAHGEGRFAAGIGRIPALARRPGATALPKSGQRAGDEFPRIEQRREAAAAVCNARGNVLAMMPHPERAQDLGALARSIGGEWGERRNRALAAGETEAEGPGMLLFHGLARYLKG